MAAIQGPGGESAPINPRDKVLYEQEYRRGADLFQRALSEYNRADEIHKKEAFREVMDHAMQVLNDTARELKRADLLAQNQKISQSLQAMEESASEKTELAKDLKDAKKMV